MITDRTLSEWKADLSTLRTLWFEQYQEMEWRARRLTTNKKRRLQRPMRSAIRKHYRQWVTLGSQIRLCQAAIIFHEAMLTHIPQ